MGVNIRVIPSSGTEPYLLCMMPVERTTTEMCQTRTRQSILDPAEVSNKQNNAILHKLVIFFSFNIHYFVCIINHS